MIGPSVTGAGICGRPGRSMATLSMNDEIALSAWSTLFCANSRTCGGTSIFNFGSIMAVSLRDGLIGYHTLEGRRSANPPRSVTRSIVALAASAISGAWSLIFWIEHKPLAVYYLAVLSNRHVDAGAALSIG